MDLTEFLFEDCVCIVYDVAPCTRTMESSATPLLKHQNYYRFLSFLFNITILCLSVLIWYTALACSIFLIIKLLNSLHSFLYFCSYNCYWTKQVSRVNTSDLHLGGIFFIFCILVLTKIFIGFYEFLQEVAEIVPDIKP